MRETHAQTEHPVGQGIYVVGPWRVSGVSRVAAVITLAIRRSESPFFWTMMAISIAAITMPASIVAARVSYVASTHVNPGLGRRAAFRYFVATFLLVSVLMLMMLPSLDREF